MDEPHEDITGAANGVYRYKNGKLVHAPHLNGDAIVAPRRTAMEETKGVPAADAAAVAEVKPRVPDVGDSVRFVLRALGSGVKHWPKIRPAIVTEDWKGAEKRPVIKGPDGLPLKPFPETTINLHVILDGHARKDLNEGHNAYEGNVPYDPQKAHGTWHWPGE